MVASYMKDYTAFELLALAGGTATITHNLYTNHPGLGLDTTKQIVTVDPWFGGTLPHAIVPYVSAQTNDTVTIIGTVDARVKVTVTAIHSVQQ